MMNVEGNFRDDRYAMLRGLVAPEIGDALLKQLWTDLREQEIPTVASNPKLIGKKSLELHGRDYVPLSHFHWGMTAAVSAAAGADLLPSYCYFRLYAGGDMCRVHSDRPASEVALSLTLAYADGLPWGLSIGTRPIEAVIPIADDFADQPFATLLMEPGDAVLYRGTELRHGRITPNPNRWSAHLFMMWVERGGDSEELAFESRTRPQDG